MPSRLNPYLNFDGRAREAMAFYRAVFGGELTTNTYGESGMSSGPETDDRIMHSQLETPSGFVLMASDIPPGMSVGQGGGGVSISLSGEDEAELRGYWDKLRQDASISMPLEKAPWGDTFGQLTDRFGVTWMVNIGGAATQ